MTWRVTFLTAIAVATFLLAGWNTAPRGGPADAADLSGKPSAELAPLPRLAFMYQFGFTGRVTEIGKDSITVQGFSAGLPGARPEYDRRKGSITWTGWPPGTPFTVHSAPLGPNHDIRAEVKSFNNGLDSGPGWEIPAVRAVQTRESITITHPDGKVTVLRRADEPPRTFPVEWSYTVGVVPDGLRAPDTYRPSDLRVGDEVRLRFRHDLGQGTPNIVHGIRIDRRPGGRIPLPPGGLPEAAADYRDRQQAYQDWEEKGTPIPWKFLTPDERADRIAPPPREVLPRIPPGKD